MGGWRPQWAGQRLWSHHLLPLAHKGTGMTWTVQTNIQSTAEHIERRVMGTGVRGCNDRRETMMERMHSIIRMTQWVKIATRMKYVRASNTRWKWRTEGTMWHCWLFQSRSSSECASTNNYPVTRLNYIYNFSFSNAPSEESDEGCWLNPSISSCVISRHQWCSCKQTGLNISNIVSSAGGNPDNAICHLSDGDRKAWLPTFRSQIHTIGQTENEKNCDTAGLSICNIGLCENAGLKCTNQCNLTLAC